MTSEVVTVRPETSLKDVAGILAERRISGVPVVAEDGEVVGVVSEGDILFKERGPSERKGILAWLFASHDAEAELKLEARTAGEAMTAPAKTIAPWLSVSTAAGDMLEESVNRLPVVESDGKLVGIVTRADLVRAFVRPDAEIEQEIRRDLLQNTLWLRFPEAVTVSVDRGKVTLGGSVDTRAEAELVSTLVARIPGVVELDSSLRWRDDDGGSP
jgi:CBS domain-containing protein